MATQMTAPIHAVMLDETAIEELRGRLRGPLLTAGDPDYDEARAVRNGLIDRHPALIARCSGTADVVECVNFARDRNLLLSVRGGAHNVAGNAVNDGGLVIDLSHMRGVYVDPDTRTVRAQGGATWGDVDRETQLFGLAVPGGVVSSTGIGGLTIHGGYGHLRRKHGLSLDSLLSVEIVTADGQVRTASATENEDLFWAVRGAGSNFGAITSFEFRLHPVGPVVQLCAPFYALEDGPRVIRAWRDFVASAPDEINSVLVLWSVPDDEHFPEELRRRPVVVLAVVYAGPVEEGERLMQPLRELATPLMDLSDEAIDTMVDVAMARPSFMSGVTFWHLGGAMGRVGSEETAYGRRDAPYLFTTEASWENPETNEENIAWAREGLAAMAPFSHGGSYLNFPGFGEEKEAMLRASYGPNYDRLVQLKTTYDPGNLFRMNLNIPPRG